MAQDDASWRRLGDRIKARRTRLTMTQDDVRAAGGPSTATQRILERGEPGSYRPSIVAGLERALRWPAGTVQAILDGEDPAEDEEPARDALAMTVAAIDDEAIAAVMRNPRVPEHEKRQLVEILIHLRRQDQQRRNELAAELTRRWDEGRSA